MFASQLLRIFETIPADLIYETWDVGAPEVKLTMKENLRHSNGFEREADPLVCGVQDGHDSWNASICNCSEVVDRMTNSDDSEAGGFQMAGYQEGHLCHSNGCKTGLEASDDKDKLCSKPEFEHSIIVDSFSDCGEKESGDSERLFTTVSQLFGSDLDTQFYTDKSVRECELSEVIVCYKESNYQIVKDICVDEGLTTQGKGLVEADNDGHAGLFVSQPCGEDKHGGTIKVCHDIEPSPDGPKASTVEDIIHSVSNECGTQEVDIATSSLDGSKPSSEDSAGKDATNVSGPGNLTQMGETNWSATERTAVDVSEDESTISSRHNLQDLIVQDSLLDSSNVIGNEAPKQLDQVPSVEAIFDSAFTTEDSKKNDTADDLHYNSKVESGTITFDFRSSTPAVDMDGSAEQSHKESLNSEDVTVPKHSKLNDLSASTTVESPSRADKNENILEPETQSRDMTNLFSQVQRGEGESSFSSSGPLSGLITYSGPIAYSGSTSLRSDSSTTSTRSFAFPVLQSEWNSSPVRMTKADRRHLRKHRGWRQGLFCCRF